MMDFITYMDRDEMFRQVAAWLERDLRIVLATGCSATFVVPGGTTPGPVFDLLCQVQLAWPRVNVMLSDERWLPEADVRSNTRLLSERLLVGRAAQAGYLPLYAPYDEPEHGLAELSLGLGPHLPVSVLLLGMGADMHTASLFPSADNLAAALAPDAPILLPMRAPGAPEVRITLSARVLDTAKHKHLLIAGEAKRQALEQAQNLSSLQAPVRSVLNHTTVHWAP